MALITITKGSHHHGAEIAQALAGTLGYDCFSREKLRHEAAEQFGLPEAEFTRDIESPPSLLDRITGGKAVYVAYLRSVFLKHVLRGDAVYHGYLGQFFLGNVPHVLKVLITASEECRVEELLKRETRMPAEAARTLLHKMDESREQWCRHVYGVNPWESGLYDLVYRIDQLSTDDVVASLSQIAALPWFKSASSRALLADLALAAEIEVRLMERYSQLRIAHLEAKDGAVTISGSVDSPQAVENIRHEVERVEGVKQVDLNIHARAFGVGA